MIEAGKADGMCWEYALWLSTFHLCCLPLSTHVSSECPPASQTAAALTRLAGHAVTVSILTGSPLAARKASIKLYVPAIRQEKYEWLESANGCCVHMFLQCRRYHNV